MELINKRGKIIGTKKLPLTDANIKKQFFFRTPINHPSTMTRRECFKKIGHYKKDMEPADDLDFLVRISQKYMLGNIPKVLLDYRIHGENMSITKQKDMIRKTLLIRKNMQLM